ncbi:MULTISPECIES: hypothetical protein [unclassified Acinetobacter]|uniref:hypothetical protein n=1 Tax=unclassified Acinetobacter TaxID=196816 RepID=UPI0035B83017
MSEKVKVKLHENIQFPACCVHCLSEDNLQLKSLTSGRVASVGLAFGGLKYNNEIMDIHYPVCDKHAKKSFWTYVYTRRTLGFQLFRGFTYFYGLPSLLLILLTTLNLILGKGGTDMPSVFIAILVIAAISFIFLIKAMLTCPLKMTSHRENTMTLKFKNEQYAEKFKRLNHRFIE